MILQFSRIVERGAYGDGRYATHSTLHAFRSTLFPGRPQNRMT
jgi:hypothetical protein